MTSALFLGFVAVMTTFVVALIDRYINRRAALRVLAGLVVWFLYAGLMGHFGIIGKSEMRPPGIAFIVIPVLLFLIFFVVRLSASAQGVLAFPLWLILGTQCFRVAVELFLHQLWIEGMVHRMMTFEGANIDIYRAVGSRDRMVVHPRAMGTNTCKRLEYPRPSRPVKCCDSRCTDSSWATQSDPHRNSRSHDDRILVPISSIPAVACDRDHFTYHIGNCSRGSLHPPSHGRVALDLRCKCCDQLVSERVCSCCPAIPKNTGSEIVGADTV